MKNIKKNTGANPHISMHTEIMFGRITQKINEIGRKTYALKKKENETTMKKEYNARGEKIYTNAINRENAKIKKEGHSEFH